MVPKLKCSHEKENGIIKNSHTAEDKQEWERAKSLSYTEDITCGAKFAALTRKIFFPRED